MCIRDRNPLEEVLCQLRFPPLLRIEAEIPVAFQDAVRGRFPQLRESRSIGVPVGVPAEIADLIGKVAPPRASYEFVTGDDRYALALTRDFVALTTRDYTQWNDFRDHLQIAIRALEEVYAPDGLTRVGLRY